MNEQHQKSSDQDPLVQRVLAVISRSKGVEAGSLHLDTSFEELDLDSLDGVNLAFDLEEEFDIEIPDEAVRFVRTVREIVDNLRPLVEGQPQQ
jgi:acyl carrier protein